jgi:hypothetical protein
MDRTERITDPALSILSATTEGWFLDQINSRTEQMSGFTQRFLYCVIREVDLNDINTDYREGYEQNDVLNRYEAIYKVLRNIPGSNRLKLSKEAIDFLNSAKREKMKYVQKQKNDTLLSYFTRIYDGYFFKFCIIFSLFEQWEKLKDNMEYADTESFFRYTEVSEMTASQAFYLCDYYFENTLPLLKILSEQGKLNNEKKFADLLKERFNGKATHSQMMTYAHFTAKEMKAIVETLIEMNVIELETGNNGKGKKSFIYTLNPKYLGSSSST